MARRSTFPLYDRILDGQLRELLLGWRSEGKSLDDIAYQELRDRGIQVSGSTVARWLKQLEAEDAEAVA